MSDLSPETEKLLALARGAGSLSDARRAQIRAGLMAQIAAGGAVGGAASYALWGKAAWLSSPLVKGLSAVALLSALSVGVYVETRPHPVAPGAAASTSSPVNGKNPVALGAPSVVHGSSPAAVGTASDPSAPSVAAPDTANTAHDANTTDTSNEAPAEVGASAPASDGVAQPSAAHQNPSASTRAHASSTGTNPSPSSTVAAANADTLAEETALLRQADQALRAGNAARALSLLNEDATRFPHGMLGPERSAEQMIARCQLGQIDAKTAQSYVSTHANSPFAARLADACHVSR